MQGRDALIRDKKSDRVSSDFVNCEKAFLCNSWKFTKSQILQERLNRLQQTSSRMKNYHLSFTS